MSFTWARAHLHTEVNGGGASKTLTPSANVLRSSEALQHPVRSITLNPAKYYDQLLFLFYGMPSTPQIPYLGHEQHGILPGIPAMGDFNGPFVQFWNVKQDGSGPLTANLADHNAALPGPTGSGLPTSALLVRARRQPEFRWWTGRVFPAVWDTMLQLLLDALPLPTSIAADPVETIWLPYPMGAPHQLSATRSYLIVHQGLKVDTFVRNVQACLNVYLEVQVDTTGQLAIQYVHADYHVWPGTNGHLVAAGLQRMLPFWSGAWQIATQIFTFFSDIQAERALVLPGRQDLVPANPADDVLYGHANTDHATIIAQPPMSSLDHVGTSTIESFLDELGDFLREMFGAFDGLALPPININIGPITDSTVMQVNQQIDELNG